MKLNLLIVNYTLDIRDPLLSHQVEVVARLSKEFERVWVASSFVPSDFNMPNVNVLNYSWDSRHKILSLVHFLRATLPILLKNDIVVFSHMTDIQSAVLSPFTRLLGVRHFLWYAHKVESIYLRWSKHWVTGVVTCTPGSVSISSKYLVPVGHGIDTSLFERRDFLDNSLLKWIHVGRFDKSKNIGGILAAVETLRAEGYEITFRQVGSPSDHQAQLYKDGVTKNFFHLIESEVVEFESSILRESVSMYLQESDLFVHAYEGSLDKSVLEATVVGLPVITLNAEYIKIFGSWGKVNRISLTDEYRSLCKLNKLELKHELERRRKIVLENHSLDSWISGITMVLSSAKGQ